MKTKTSYYIILTVYVSLWACQQIACHRTHSLVILTDSYINLYKVLDILLGILHLNTQKRVTKRKQIELNNITAKTNGKQHEQSGALNVFGSNCTYQFKRLPVLGSFINGLFLAALLILAAIEGIQSCFHFQHLEPSKNESILVLLIGFALVDLIMEWCSSKAHEMREEELDSESLSNLSSASSEPRRLLNNVNYEQLNVENIDRTNQFSDARINAKFEPHLKHSNGKSNRNNFVLNSSSRHKSFESVLPRDTNDRSNISLKSLKIATNIDSPGNLLSISSISKDLAANKRGAKNVDACWRPVRYCTSPAALLACALIVYLINNEQVTEVADAILAVVVVILLFIASYPNMQEAGRVLLQVAPEEVDLDRLRADILSVSPLIAKIDELFVWSLTPTSNRIATCKISIKTGAIESPKQLSDLIREVKFRFLDQNIKCSTIQPNLISEPITGRGEET